MPPLVVCRPYVLASPCSVYEYSCCPIPSRQPCSRASSLVMPGLPWLSVCASSLCPGPRSTCHVEAMATKRILKSLYHNKDFLHPPPSKVAICFASCAKNDALFAIANQLTILCPNRRRMQLTLARSPNTSTTLRSTLRSLLHFVRGVSSLCIPRQVCFHFCCIEATGRCTRRSAFRSSSSVARLTALSGALGPEVAWLLRRLVLCLRLLGW